MLSILSQPKQQNAEATILTLCDRLAHSNLVEDRRAAALSLKGFSHGYRELIASAGLQGLLDSLKTDSYDLELRRACLETLIVLFIKTGEQDLVEQARAARERHKTYTSPLLTRKSSQKVLGDEISLLLTDRFTQLPENIELLLKIVEEKPDVFSTLYSLQLISAIVLNRPERAGECLMSIPNGISLLVRTLDSNNEMIRNEGILLLLHLTEENIDCQKLIAFEGAFELVITIVNDEGGLGFGASAIIEDCLGLLRNLLEYNVSNQKLFCASGCISLFTNMLVFDSDFAFESETSASNISLALQLPRLFCVPGAEATIENQTAFGSAGFVITSLRLAFGPHAPISVRVSAILTVASLVDDNSTLQHQLLEVDVPYYDLSISMNVIREPVVLPVSHVLLNWMMMLTTTQLFDLRAACLELLCSTFSTIELRTTFIQEQLTLYKAADPNANIIGVLAEFNEDANVNPFRVWFCSALVINLFDSAPTIKDQLRSVQIGDEKLGQEVIPILQSIGSQLLESLNYREPFTALAYLQLLIVWLFDDVPAVEEFLAESSVVQGLVGYIASNLDAKPNLLVQSLATVLLGVAYDFSTNNSPFSRASFHKLLTSTLGTDQYVQQVRRFRQSEVYRDFLPSNIFGAPRGANGLPAVFLDAKFYDFISEHVGRIQRAINKSPDFEPTFRISLEMYEELRGELMSKEQAMEKYKHDKELELKTLCERELDLNAQLKKLKAEHQSLQTAKSELNTKIKDVGTTLETTIKQLKTTRAELDLLKAEHTETVTEATLLRSKLEASTKESSKLNAQLAKLSDAKEKAEAGINKMTRELITLTRGKESSEKELSSLKTDHGALVTSQKALKATSEQLKKQLEECQESNAQLKATNEKIVAKLRETAEILKSKEEDETMFEQAVEDLEKSRAEIDAANMRLSNYEREKQLMKQKLESTKKEYEALQVRHKKLEKSSSDAGAELEKAKSDASANTKKLEEQLDSLKAELKVKYEAVSKLEKQKKGLESASKDLKTAQAETTKLSADLETSKAESAKLRTDLEDAKEELKKLSKELETNRSELEKLKRDLDAAKAESTKLNTELEACKMESELSRTEMNASRADSTKLSAELEASKAAVAKLQNQVKERDEAKSGLSKDLATSKAIVSSLEDQIQELEASNSKGKQLEKDLESNKATVADLTKKLATSERTLETAKKVNSEVKSLQDKISSYESQLKDLQTSSDKARKDSGSEVKAITAKYEQETKAKAELETKLSESERKVTSLNDQIADLEASASAKSANDSESTKKIMDAFKTRLQDKDSKIEEYETSIKALEQDKLAATEVESELKKAKAASAKDKATIEEHEKQKAEASKTESELKDKLAKSEEAAAALKETQVTELNEQLAKSEKQAVEAKKAETELKEKLAQIEKRGADLEKQQKAAASIAEAKLREKLSKSEKLAADLKAKQDEIETELKELKDKLAEREKAASLLEEERNTDAAKTVDELKEKLAKSEKHSAELEEKLKIQAKLEEKLAESEGLKDKQAAEQEEHLAKSEKLAADLKSQQAAAQKAESELKAQLAEQKAEFTTKIKALEDKAVQNASENAVDSTAGAELAKLKVLLKEKESSHKAKEAELEEKSTALDELMALLDDLTEQKAKYKQQLRGLEMAVSDSEDDSDEEE